MSKLSVITPTLNMARWLPETVASVAALQSPHEQLIIDAASTDGTVEYLQGLDDPSVRWISEPDRGQPHAMNKGLDRVEGDLVGWLNADDAYVPDAVDRAIAFLDAHPEVDAVFGWEDVIDDDGNVVGAIQPGRFSWRRWLFVGDYIPTETIIFRKRLLDGGERLDERYKDSSDYDFFLRVLKGRRVHLMREPLVRFRYWEGSKTEQNVRLRAEAQEIRHRWARDDRDMKVMNAINWVQELRNRVLDPWPEVGGS